VAIVLLAAGSAIAGFLVLVFAAALLGLFAGGVRREPDAPAAKPMLSASGHLRSRARFATVTGREWTRTGWKLVLIRRRQQALRRELKATLGATSVDQSSTPAARRPSLLHSAPGGLMWCRSSRRAA
jgi:hypothetical protein